MNWNALTVIGLGVLLIIVGSRGSQTKIWNTFLDISGLGKSTAPVPAGGGSSSAQTSVFTPSTTGIIGV